MPNATLTDLVDKHAELLRQAQAVARTREYWSAFPESPSPRVYGESAAAEGEQAFQARLGTTFDLGQPTDGTTVGEERSPYGFDLNVGYPHATTDQLLEAAGAALPAWQAATPLNWKRTSERSMNNLCCSASRNSNRLRSRHTWHSMIARPGFPTARCS